MRRARNINAVEIADGRWVAFEGDELGEQHLIEAGRCAYGPSEDYAVSQWWALYNLPERFPHLGEEGYVQR